MPPADAPHGRVSFIRSSLPAASEPTVAALWRPALTHPMTDESCAAFFCCWRPAALKCPACSAASRFMSAPSCMPWMPMPCARVPIVYWSFCARCAALRRDWSLDCAKSWPCCAWSPWRMLEYPASAPRSASARSLAELICTWLLMLLCVLAVLAALPCCASASAAGPRAPAAMLVCSAATWPIWRSPTMPAMLGVWPDARRYSMSAMRVCAPRLSLAAPRSWSGFCVLICSPWRRCA